MSRQGPRQRIDLTERSVGVNVVLPLQNGKVKQEDNGGEDWPRSGNDSGSVDNENNTITCQADPLTTHLSPRHQHFAASMSASIRPESVLPDSGSFSPSKPFPQFQRSVKDEILSKQYDTASTSMDKLSPFSEKSNSSSGVFCDSNFGGVHVSKCSSPAPISAIDGKSPISQLQEVCVLHGLGLPIYTETGQMGPPHERMFSISVKAAGCLIEGRGLTKKAAKTEAARIALQMMRDEDKSSNGMTILNILDGQVDPTSNSGIAVNGLKHLMNGNGVNGNGVNGNGVNGHGVNGNGINGTAPVAQMTSMMESMSVGDPSPAEDHYVVQNLYALCGKNGFSSPEYEEISVEGTSHEPMFTIRVAIRSLNVSATATGRSKIAAKRTAAHELLTQLRDHVGPGSSEGRSLTGGSADMQDQDLEYKHRMKYRIPTMKHAAPSVMFELFRQIENSKFPQFDECLSRIQENDQSYDYFEALIQICTLLGIKAVTHENEAVSRTAGTSYEALIMLSFKEIPIMTTYASSEVSRHHAIQETAFRSVVSLCCSQRLVGPLTSSSGSN